MFLKLLSPRVGETLHGIAVNDDVEGFLTHWVNDATAPCLGEEAGCEGCTNRRKARWKGFLPVMMQPAGIKVMFEITRGAAESCPALVGPEVHLRGRWLKLYRNGRAKRSPCVLEVLGPATKIVLPPPVSVVEVLHNLWGLVPTGGSTRPLAVDPGELLP